MSRTCFDGPQHVGVSGRLLLTCVVRVSNWRGSPAVCGWLELAGEQMQPAIHALRAAADSSVKHDGVADRPASLSVPWLAG